MNFSSNVYKSYMKALNSGLSLKDFPLPDKRIRAQIDDITYNFKLKNKVAAFMTSHCETSSKRLKIVQLLNLVNNSNFIEIYGSCGKLRCQIRNPRGPWCWKNVFAPNYYFYFSMENTLCDEYITEKVYMPLKYGLVPVVYGGKLSVNFNRF